MFNSIKTSLARSSVVSRTAVRSYARPAKKNQPKFRYLVYTFLFSSAALVFVSLKVDRKPPPRTSFSEKEFQEFEETTKLKRRHKIITDDLSSKFNFYVLPFIKTESIEQFATMSNNSSSAVVKVIDPLKLIEIEKSDTSKKFLFLLQELDVTKKPFPKGLITALIKEEIQSFINSEEEIVKTNFFITNYPQTTDEAIKFENDIGDIKKCLVLHYDMLNELPAQGNEFERSINNVVGYFETVGKNKTITNKFDNMDAKLREIVLQDY